MNGRGIETTTEDVYITATVMALREVGSVGPRTFQTILAVFGSPENIYDAAVDDLTELSRVSEERAVRILSSRDVIPMMEERIERLLAEGTRVATFLSDDYPARLRALDDPPPVIYYRGKLPDESRRAISIVGTTNATSEGIAATVDIASRMSAMGYSVVSGLARGIDTAAHIGALKNDGITLAVIGSGFYNLYPEENSVIAEQICDKGTLLTEYPPDTSANTGRLIARNRIVVGLSDSTIVAELQPGSSGSLSAAEACDRQGKLLFYLFKGDEMERGIDIPRNAIPFENLEDIQTILENSIGS